MKTKRLLLLAPLLLCLFIYHPTKAQVNTGDSLALVDLYNATNGPGWIQNRNWLSGPVAASAMAVPVGVVKT